MKRWIFIPLILITLQNLLAQQSSRVSSSEILQGLNKLNTIGSVLYIAAHPDDENTRFLAYLSKEKKVRTGYLSLTRGDGGQNLIGKEQAEALGLIRTHELLQARRVDGAEQFFTRANDFGFSKNPEETLEFWNKDSILSDVVWVIRNFKPDIIVCRFPTTGEGGHGHHTASAMLALEAFDAAADPTRYSQQLKHTEVWKTKRVFWNTFNFGATNTTAANQLQVDVGEFNPLIGVSYGEISAESRSMHKSQGFGSAKTRGSQIEYFKQLKGDSVKDLFEQIDLSWNRVPRGDKIKKKIEGCINSFDVQKPEKSINSLIVIYESIKNLDSKNSLINFWKSIKIKEIESLILACSGFWAEATATDYIAIPGKPINLNIQVINRNGVNIKLNKITWPGKTDTITTVNLKRNELVTIKHKELLSENSAYSNPYWLNEKHSPGLYTVKDQNEISKAQNDASSVVKIELSINNEIIEVTRDVVYKFTDPVKGEIYRPLEVLPPATVNLSEKVYVFVNSEPKNIYALIKANTDNVEGSLNIKVPEGWLVKLNQTDAQFKLKKGEEITIEATVVPGKKETGSVSLSAFLNIDEKVYNKSIKRIEYDHIPYQFILSNAEAGLSSFYLNKKETNIGYIPGAGDEVSACLKQVGYNVSILTDELINSLDLLQYDAIVTGIRAYNTNDRLQVYHPKLMKYVENGGNLIVQYNTNNRIGPLLAKIGPYPFTISRDRVTNENAEVIMLKKNHPVVTIPNVINMDDFTGWIQERGIYFATELDSNYQTIFSMKDPAEKTHEGSLIIAKYGKGNFVYTGLAFFRQLPAGVPGAYRLFTNLISLPENK